MIVRDSEQENGHPVLPAEAFPAEFWMQPRDLAGVRLDVEAAIALLEDAFPPYLKEFQQLERAGELQVNDWYGTVDAESLYAIVRHFKPRTVLELGSGWSSLVIGAAIGRNAEEGNPAWFRIFDPFPRDKLEPAIRRHGELSRTKAEQVPLEAFERLDANDIVFVDTTHVVNVGGDVDYLILDVLPRLSTGVLAHVHDIFLPYQYPRQWIEVEKRAYTEQHLLHAFLAFNDRFEVVFPAHAIARKYPERVRAVIPTFHDGVNPGAFWIRRSAGED